MTERGFLFNGVPGTWVCRGADCFHAPEQHGPNGCCYCSCKTVRDKPEPPSQPGAEAVEIAKWIEEHCLVLELGDVHTPKDRVEAGVLKPQAAAKIQSYGDRRAQEGRRESEAQGPCHGIYVPRSGKPPEHREHCTGCSSESEALVQELQRKHKLLQDAVNDGLTCDDKPGSTCSSEGHDEDCPGISTAISLMKYHGDLQAERALVQELLGVLKRAEEWMAEDGCDCGQPGVDDQCAPCIVRAAIASAERRSK